MTDLRAPMRKTFNLNIEGKNRDRVLEATKHEIRKYVKRQRRVPLPEGVDFWDFDCKFGTSADNAATIHFAELTEKIDAVVQAGGETFLSGAVGQRRRALVQARRHEGRRGSCRSRSRR